MRRLRSASGGFTLLELLVAIGIFAIFSSLAYASLLRMLDTRDRLDREREFWRELALASARLEDDLATARPRSVRDVYGNPLPALRGRPVDPRALGEPSLEFTRGGRPLLGADRRSDLQRVGYRLQDGTLWRLAWPDLDRAPASQPLATPLLEQVSELRLRFYAPGGGWVDQWPPDGQPRMLPAAVELTFTLEGRGQFTRILRVNG